MCTICVECAYLTHSIAKPNPPHVWHNFFCSASPREPTVDRVTGKKGFKAKNDLGGEYVIVEPYHYCKHANKGNCPLFKIATK